MKPDQPAPLAAAQTNPRLHRIHCLDNVAVALVDLAALEEASAGETILVLRQPVAFGHKVALADIKKGSPIIKYGEQIGMASHDIAAGEHVHVHNVESTRGRGDLAAVTVNEVV